MLNVDGECLTGGCKCTRTSGSTVHVRVRVRVLPEVLPEVLSKVLSYFRTKVSIFVLSYEGTSVLSYTCTEVLSYFRKYFRTFVLPEVRR